MEHIRKGHELTVQVGPCCSPLSQPDRHRKARARRVGCTPKPEACCRHSCMSHHTSIGWECCVRGVPGWQQQQPGPRSCSWGIENLTAPVQTCSTFSGFLAT